MIPHTVVHEAYTSAPDEDLLCRVNKTISKHGGKHSCLLGII